MQRKLSPNRLALPSEKITSQEKEKNDQLQVEGTCVVQDEEMANLCTPRNGILSPVIATRPLNLTLLNKRKSREVLYHDRDEEEDDYDAKKPRVEEHEHDQDQDSVLLHPGPEHMSNGETTNEEGVESKNSKASILQHFYSFIQRKVDKGEIDGKLKSETSNNDDKHEEGKSSILPISSTKFSPEISQDENGPQNTTISPSASPSETFGLDYNSIISQRLARANASNLLDFWSKMAGNMYARAKRNSEEDSSPPLSNMGNEYETKSSNASSFTSSPTPSNIIPERTMRQNNWAVKVWRDWAIERNARSNANGRTGPLDVVPLDIKDASMDGMSYWLPRFITEVRRRDKRSYPPDTLMQIASGLQRHLRHVSGRNDITFFDKYSPTFAEFREALKSRSEAINSETAISQRGDDNSGDGGCNGTDAWSSSFFNLNTAKGIFRAIFYYNCVAFHITSMEEHHALAVVQYRIGFDEEKHQEYLEFTRENGSQPVLKYASSYDPRCIVKVFKTYFQHIPSAGLLYKRPLQSSDNSELRFSFNPVGINKLRETFKMLFGGRRSGSHMMGMDEEDERDVSMQSIMRLHPNTDDIHRSIQLERSPGSEASSVASFSRSRRDSGAENQQPNDGESCVPPRPPVITKVERHKEDEEEELDEQVPRMFNTAIRSKILVENNNNNASATEEDDCLTLKVPAYVKYVMIQQGSKRIKINLDTMT